MDYVLRDEEQSWDEEQSRTPERDGSLELPDTGY